MSSGFTLRNGQAKSCGCLTTEQLKERGTTHKRSRTPEYVAWAGMLQRCNNPKNVKYHRYGGRGIKVCDEWYAFENFIADMGERPTSKHTIERIDGNKGYMPSNCKWATKREQNHNKSDNHFLVYHGKRMTLTQAVDLSGTKISRGTVAGRLKRGWTPEQAIDTPPDPNVFVWRLNGCKPKERK